MFGPTCSETLSWKNTHLLYIDGNSIANERSKGSRLDHISLDFSAWVLSDCSSADWDQRATNENITWWIILFSPFFSELHSMYCCNCCLHGNDSSLSIPHFFFSLSNNFLFLFLCVSTNTCLLPNLNACLRWAVPSIATDRNYQTQEDVLRDTNLVLVSSTKM